MELLIAALQDEDMGVREAAARAFGQIGDSRAVEPLIAMLKDRNRKHEAVRYKGKFIGSICIKGSTAGPRSVCWAAAEALGKIGDSRAVEPLIAALKEKDPIRNLIEVLGQIGDARAVELFIAFLSTRGEVGLANMRRQAAEALVRIYH